MIKINENGSKRDEAEDLSAVVSLLLCNEACGEAAQPFPACSAPEPLRSLLCGASLHGCPPPRTDVHHGAAADHKTLRPEKRDFR